MYRLENNIIKTEEYPLDDGCQGGLGYMCYNFMKRHGDILAQVNISTGEKESYSRLLRKCVKTAMLLQDIGIKKGDMVVFCSKTNLNSCVPVIASFFIGAIPSYLDATLPVFEITHFIKIIHPKILLVTADFIDEIRNIIKSGGVSINIVEYNNDFTKSEDQESQFSPIYVDNLEETAIIHFSSGSTGFPKGIWLNHYSLVYSRAFIFGDFWIQGTQKVILSLDSLYWSIETLRLICSIKEGVSRLINSEDIDMKNIWQHLEMYKVNLVFFTPQNIIQILEEANIENRDLSSLTTMFVEGSLLPLKYHKSIQKLLPHVDIFHWYGQTEAGELTAFRKTVLHRHYNNTKPGCVGTPIPGFGTSLKVVSIDNGNILGPNEHGELCVKSKSVMNGYLDSGSTDYLDEDGWLKTGDIVYYDEDFCFFVVDRIKDLIKFQGWPVIPALIEAEILKHSAVKCAAVIGVPNDIDDEHPMALVALHRNCDNITSTEIKKFVEDRIPERYYLRGGVKITRDKFFQNGNKLKKFRLKQLILSGEI